MNTNAFKVLENLRGEAVRITVKTDELYEGNITYADFTCMSDIMNGDMIKGFVMYSDGVNNMGISGQILVKILKIEVFNFEWIEIFSAKKHLQ